MGLKQWIVGYLALILIATATMLHSCQSAPVQPAQSSSDEAAADQAWEQVYGGLSETDLAKAVVLEPVGGVQ